MGRKNGQLQKSVHAQLVFQIAANISYTYIKCKEWTPPGARTTHNFREDDFHTCNFDLKVVGISAKVAGDYAETSFQTWFLFHSSNNRLSALVSRFKMMKSRLRSVECGTLKLMVIVIKRSAAVMGRERF